MSTIRRAKMVKRLSWQDMSPSSPKIRLTRRIVQLEGEKISAEILRQAKTICNEYIEAKLERDGFTSRSLSPNSPTEVTSRKNSEVSHRIQEIGELLELGYPALYMNISSQLNVSFSNENAVHEAFNNVSSEILSDGVNWPRIVAVYAFCGALVCECYKEGRNSFVLNMGNWMYEFAALHFVEWIKLQGGWEDALLAFPKVATSRGYPLVITEANRWRNYLVVQLKTWCEIGFAFLRHFKAYLRKVPIGLRKPSN